MCYQGGTRAHARRASRIVAFALGFVVTASRAAAEPSVNWAGDVGVRAEYIANEAFAERDSTRDDDHRARARVRARVGATFLPAPSVTMGFRVTTGDPSFPTSAWSSFSDDFRRDVPQIDRAYVHWQPTARIWLRAGADENPLFAPTELLWDKDVQPSGVAERVRLGSGFSIIAGQFVLRELRASRPDNEEGSFMLAESFQYEHDAADWKITTAVAHYWFTNPDAIARAVQVGEFDGEFKTNRLDPMGRTVVDPKDPTRMLPVDSFSRYTIIQAAARVQHVPSRWLLSAEAAVNIGARSDDGLGAAYAERENFAGAVVARYGSVKLANSGDWYAAGGFAWIEADAVVATFNSDDLQQTNVACIPLEVGVRVERRVDLVVDAYVQRKVDTALPSNGGVVHDENAPKLRARLSASVQF